jgi:hypothetical protein
MEETVDNAPFKKKSRRLRQYPPDGNIFIKGMLYLRISDSHLPFMSMEFKASPLCRFLAFALVAISFFGCSKDEPDNSAVINAELSLFSNAAMQGKITINQAVVNVEQIQITGTQPSLSTITFTHAVPDAESMIELINSDKSIVRVDAERNDYDPLTVTLTLRKDSHELAVETTENGVTTNIDSYLQQAQPSFLLNARFDNRGRSVPVYIAFPDVMPLKSIAEQYGSVQVKIDVENLAEIQINPGYLFDGISTQQLESAAKATHQNQEVIFIHPEFNSSLYTTMLSRLEEAQNSMKVKVRVTRSAVNQ